MGDTPVKVGVVGCGKISDIYLKNCRASDDVEVVACADLDEDRAREKAALYGVERAGSVAELLAAEDIEVVLNLTVPQAHATVSLAALREGKSVHTEKPLAIDLDDARRMLEEAGMRDLRIGCAPDTFLGGGLQTCRGLIDEGAIGEPVAATALMMNHGPEDWHPDPDFFYQHGAGPMFDMGPYYLTALATLIGPIRRVTGSARVSFPERSVTSEPKYGTKIRVNTPTHVTGVMDFENGCIGTLVTSFDVWTEYVPRIEIYGTEGSLRLPDPNTFGGPVLLWRPEKDGWTEISLTHGNHTGNSRGIGLVDLARALRSGGPHRATGELGFHVLEVMHAFGDSSREGRHVEVASSFERPAPLPAENTFWDVVA
jgi:predicted dehydrogenase